MSDIDRWRKRLARRLEADRKRREAARPLRKVESEPDTETARHPAPAPEHWTPKPGRDG